MARPVEYDRNTVLENATDTFWENGYFATSMASLVESTQLNPGSLYAAFSSKEGLLLATIDHYGQRSVNRVKQILSEAASPIEGIRTYLEQLTTQDRARKIRRGCFMVNTALEVAPHNEAVRDKLNLYLSDIEACFARALLSARELGEMSKDKDPKTLAKFLMVNIWGIRVLQRISPNAKTLKAMAQTVCQTLAN